LRHQFSDGSGRGGERHLSDLVGAGSADFGKDGRKENGDWEKGAPGLRESGWQDIRHLMGVSRKRHNDSQEEVESCVKKQRKSTSTEDASSQSQATVKVAAKEQTEKETSLPVSSGRLPQIFRGLTIYHNGSTAPTISDHKLKQLFAQHGGNSSIALGRRTVTHVILGNTCGGGLASGKINKENTTVGGKGIKYVSVNWVLDSVEKGIRQPEARYVPKSLDGKLGGSGQSSVYAKFQPTTK
jgi:hypothetical protein